MADITCARCGRTAPQLSRQPLRNALGQRIFESICEGCWSEWLRYQTALINHYGLDVREPEAKEFLMANMEGFLFKKGEEAEDIDTSQQGSVEW